MAAAVPNGAIPESSRPLLHALRELGWHGWTTMSELYNQNVPAHAEIRVPAFPHALRPGARRLRAVGGSDAAATSSAKQPDA
jgi:hypothetical protein